MKKIFYLFVGILLLSTFNAFAQGTTMSLGTVTAAAGDTVLVPINVSNFNNVGAISLKISYNSASLTYVGVVNAPTGVNFTDNASGGVVTLGWFDATASSPVNISNGKLVDLKFVFSGTTSNLTFNTSQCDIANETATSLSVTYTNGAVNSSSSTSLSIPNVTATPGSNISVAVQSQHFNNVGAVSLKISYDTTSLVFLGIANTINSANFTSSASNGIISLGWFDATGTHPISVDTLAKLLDLQFKFKGGTSSLSFNTAQCDISNSTGVSLTNVNYGNGQVSATAGTTPSLKLGTVTGQANVSVPLTVQSFNNVGAISLKIQYNSTALTFTNVTGAPTGLTASASAGVLTLSWFDATGKNPLSLGNGTLLNINFSYNGGSSNLTFLSSQCDVADSSGTSFVGVGYTNGAVTGATPPTLTISNVTGGSVGSTVGVPIKVQSFSNIGAVSLKINYDASVLTFTGVSNAPTGVNFTSNASGGVVSLGWFDATGTSPINLDSNKALIQLNFTYNGGSSSLTFNTSQCDIANESGTSLNNVVYNNGGVGATAPELKIASLLAKSGNNVNVPITVQSFSNVGAVSLKIAYNATALTFTGISGAPTGVNFTSNASGGVISIGWFDATGTSPINLDSNKVLLQLNFTYNGGSSALTFNTSQCDIANESGTSLNNVTYVNGGVNPQPGTSPTLSLTNMLAIPDSTVSMPLTAKLLQGIGAVSLKIQYNAAALTFNGITNLLSGTTFTATASGGVITVGWFDQTGKNPISVDSADILKLNFTFIGGTSSLTFVTAQSSLSDSAGNTLTNIVFVNGSIKQEHAPVFTNILPDTTISENQEIKFTYAATDQDSGTVLTYSMVDTVKGATFNNQTGLFDWKPAFGQAGTYSIVIAVSDGILTDTARSTLIVKHVDRPPYFTTGFATSYSMNGGDTLKVLFNGADPDGDSLRFSLAYSLRGASITAVSKTSAQFVFIAPNADATYKAVVKLSDGLLSVNDTTTITVILTGIENLPGMPTEYTLSQNYPNPFNPSTQINFDLPKESNVVLKVYNAIGQEVATLVNKELPTGSYKYQFNADNLPSGVYIYRLQAGSFVSIKKMILLK